MTLPNAIIVGGQKCGSSWLVKNLRKHPEIYGVEKEIHYFDKEDNFKKGTEWYADHFLEAKPDHQIVLEKTPDYLFDGEAGEGHMPGTADRIHALLPDCKILIVLRNPAERAISAAGHVVRSGRIPPVYSVEQLILGDKAHLLAEHKVIEYGFYHDDVKRYLDLFGKENVHIMLFEEAMKNKRDSLKEVFAFLGVDNSFVVPEAERAVNKGNKSKLVMMAKYYVPFLLKNPLVAKLKGLLPQPKARQKNPKLLATLSDMYKEDIQKLEKLLGREIPWG